MFETGRNLDSYDVRQPLREIGVHFPHEIGHMIAAHGAIVEGLISKKILYELQLSQIKH